MPIEIKECEGRAPVYAKGYHYSISGNEDKLIFFWSSTKNLYVYNYECKSLESFKTYLSETPLEVYCELEKPIYTQI